jgi:signal transduction histidine kinase
MHGSAISQFLAEPQVASPPRSVWRDWPLIIALFVTGVSEIALRQDLGERGVVALVSLPPLLSLRWRRTHPLEVTAFAFAAHLAADIAARSDAGNEYMLYTTASLLLLPYALFRWGSGRHAALGVTIMTLTHLPTSDSGITNLVEAGAAAVFILLPAALGLAVRYRDVSRIRERDQVRLRERELLARELHDSIAHHVSAIIIQAQAGRAVAADNPGAAAEVLRVIETEATKTLGEMRSIVGALRHGEPGEEAALNPQRGVRDIPTLAASATSGPRIDVAMSGPLDDLAPILDSALYRLAQEAITNATRHARHATRVAVGITASDSAVELLIEDDGDPVLSSSNAGGGYGILGMTERATLLGGTFRAGPGAKRGWQIRATLPRQTATS